MPQPTNSPAIKTKDIRGENKKGRISIPVRYIEQLLFSGLLLVGYVTHGTDCWVISPTWRPNSDRPIGRWLCVNIIRPIEGNPAMMTHQPGEKRHCIIVDLVLHEINVADILEWRFPGECQVVHADGIGGVDDGRRRPVSTAQEHGRFRCSDKTTDTRLR